MSGKLSFIARTAAATLALGVLGHQAHAQSCGLSPSLVAWETGGTTAGTGDQSANIAFGTATSAITISGQLFRARTNNTVIAFNEDPIGNGTYAINFSSQIIHSVEFYVSGLGRDGSGTFDSSIVGNFTIDTTGPVISPATIGVAPGTGGAFQNLASEPIALAPGFGSGNVGVHDPNSNGNATQAFGLIQFDYTGPGTVNETSDTIETLSFETAGDGIGPNAIFGLRAIIRSCVTAADDDFTTAPVPPAGGVTASVFADDTSNTSAADQTNVTVTGLPLSSPPASGGFSVGSDGVITVAAGTTPGTYSVPYQICENHLPSNCDTAAATVLVASIGANDDDFSSSPIDSTTGGTTASVLTDDVLNGLSVAADGSDTTLSILDADGLTGAAIADNGVITIPPNTAPGVYSILYQLCDQSNPTDCDTAIATVVVGTVVAEDDNFSSTPINNFAGGSTASVLSNDLMNGLAVATDGSQTTLTLTNNGGLAGASLADTGVITVPPNTTPATYSLAYELCDQSNPSDCDTAIATVVISGTYVPAIEEELKSVLQDDLAVTIARQSAQMSDYAKDALERLRSHNRSGAECAAAATLRARSIQFDPNQAVIRGDSERVLDEIASILDTCQGSTFEIAGHTDSDGSEAYNLDLSKRRVAAVLAALQQRDIDTTYFEPRWYGESQPIASNATAAGKAQNRRVAFNLIEATEPARNFAACHDGAAPIRNFTLRGGEAGLNVDGDLHREAYDCVTSSWSIFQGSLSFTETDSGISQGSFTLSYRRERLIDEGSIRGFFLGAYGSQSDVTTVATGSIDGFGLNAGLYGAERLRDNLFVDAHIGIATGIHEFDLAFDDALGVIEATGNYRYVAGFFGAALSGEATYESYTIGPRVGFEYAYSPGGNVDVAAASAGLSESGSLKLDTVSGGTAFAELRVARAFRAYRSELAVTPRVACYQSLESFGDDCSLGASLEVATLEATDELLYAVELSGERASSFSRVSFTASVSKALRVGMISAGAGLGSEGVQQLRGGFELRF